MDEQRHQVLIIGEIEHQAHRLAKAAPARQLAAGKGVEAAIGGEHDELVRGLGMEAEALAVAFLVFQIGVTTKMAL